MNILARLLFVLFMAGLIPDAGTVLAAADPAAPPSLSPPAASSRVVQGELLKMDGDFYTVKNKSGEEVRLRVDKDTLLDVRMKVGDKVDATLTADDRTASILKVP